METDTAAKQRRVSAEETLTDPHSLVGFGLIFALIAKVYIPVNYVVSQPNSNGALQGQAESPNQRRSCRGVDRISKDPCSSKEEVKRAVAASMSKSGKLTAN